jgi:hypothetical protein
MKYILYTSTQSENEILKSAPPEIKQHVLIQPKSQIKVPDWLQNIPTPVLVDTLKFQAMYGNEIDIFFQSKSKRTFLTKVDEID